MVKANLRLFVKGYLLNQAYGRGEALAFCDGTAKMLKNLLNTLCGLNRMYAFTEEPRWVEHYLGLMSVKPKDSWRRMKTALSGGMAGDEALEGLLEDILSLVEREMPDIDVARIRTRREQVRTRSTRRRPLV